MQGFFHSQYITGGTLQIVISTPTKSKQFMPSNQYFNILIYQTIWRDLPMGPCKYVGLHQNIFFNCYCFLKLFIYIYMDGHVWTWAWYMPSKLLFEKPIRNHFQTHPYIYIPSKPCHHNRAALPAFAGSRGANAGPAVPGRDVGPGDIFIYIYMCVCVHMHIVYILVDVCMSECV